MKEREAAARFCRQVDVMLGQRDNGASAVTPFECAGDMQVARRLRESDFTMFSDSFSTLAGTVPQTACLQRSRQRVSWSGRVADMLARRFARPLPIALVALAVALILIQCTYPGGIAGLTVKVEKAVSNILDVGPGTRVETIVDQEAARKAVAAIPQELKDQMWILSFPGSGNWGGYVPTGVSKEVLRFRTYDAARTAAQFNFVKPRKIPDGYTLQDLYVAPLGMHVISVYSRADGAAIVISQATVGTYVSIAFVSDNSFEQVEVDGTKAAWFATDGALVWEAGSVSYAIVGRGLALDDVLKIWNGMQ